MNSGNKRGKRSDALVAKAKAVIRLQQCAEDLAELLPGEPGENAAGRALRAALLLSEAASEMQREARAQMNLALGMYPRAS